MSKLKIGDEVISFDFASQTIIQDSVISFLHYEPDCETAFFSLKMQTGSCLLASGSHLVPIKSMKEEENISYIFVKDVCIGDQLLTKINTSDFNWNSVQSISKVRHLGAFAPLTNSGTIFVDGILASCYADWPS